MIYVFFAHGFEEIEAVTIVDVLRRADLTVKSVGIGSKTVTGAHGITVHCDISQREIALDKMKMMVLPGGMPGTTNLEKSTEVQNAIDFAVENDLWIAAICAAPKILGQKGLLEGKKATVFPGLEDELVGAIVVKEPVVEDGRFITANGPASAVEFSLKLVEKLVGQEKASQIGEAMQWQNKG